VKQETGKTVELFQKLLVSLHRDNETLAGLIQVYHENVNHLSVLAEMLVEELKKENGKNEQDE
jgi:hypothetical protein